MGAEIAELVAGIIERIEDRPFGPGLPPVPTVEIIKTLCFLVREGVQWHELQAAGERASGSTLRRHLDEWHKAALLRRLHAVFVHMACAHVLFQPLQAAGVEAVDPVANCVAAQVHPAGDLLRLQATYGMDDNLSIADKSSPTGVTA